MYKIVKKENLADNIYSMDIQAPRVAKSALPGQFIILIIDEKGERVPLTISDMDPEEGTVQIVVQKLGYSSNKLDELEVGDSINTFVGPLGRPSDFVNEEPDDLKGKHYVYVAGGLGTAPSYPQVRWLKENGAKVDVVMGSQSKDRVILEDKFKEIADNVYVSTDDGSYGFKGMTTDLLKHLVQEEGKKYDHCVTIGPMIMMKFVSYLTEELGIDTTVSLNPIMVDGTGMCGACRVLVDGETRFACVDGPEFDGHKVDYDLAMDRLQQYRQEEEAAEKVYWSGGKKNNG